MFMKSEITAISKQIRESQHPQERFKLALKGIDIYYNISQKQLNLYKKITVTLSILIVLLTVLCIALVMN